MDEKLGQMRDLFFNPSTYLIHYYAVNINRSFSKKWAFISTEWVNKVDWSQRVGYLNVERKTITSGPLYKPEEKISERLENALYQQSQDVDYSKSQTSYNDDTMGHLGF